MKNKYANIYDYADFRQFLKEYQKNRYAKERDFSGSGICKKLGLPNTRSYFNDVLKGKELTKSFIERFIRVLGLDADEAQFFRVLVQFNQATNDQERDLFFDQLISLNKTPKRFVDPKAYAYYKEWYHSAVRALLDVYDIKDDYKFLSKKVYPAITPKKARESVELLHKLGLIKKNRRKYWKQTDKSITAGAYVRNELIKLYQIKCFELGKQALLTRTNQHKNMSTMTVSMSEKIHDKIEQKLQKFKAEIRSMVHKDTAQAEKVYQLNIQFFPQSQ